MSLITIISGSHRPQSESVKVSRFIAARISKLCPGVQADLIELGGNPLPLWDESAWANDPKWDKEWKAMSQKLKASDAVVVVSPEWAGMVPPGLKNMFLLCSKQELAHKPGMIVTVSAGINGAYPVAELRATSSKNNQLCYIPDHVIVRKAKEVLNDPEKSSGPDEDYLRKRIDYSVQVLHQYAIAFRSIRESGVLNLKEFPFGM